MEGGYCRKPGLIVAVGQGIFNATSLKIMNDPRIYAAAPGASVCRDIFEIAALGGLERHQARVARSRAGLRLRITGRGEHLGRTASFGIDPRGHSRAPAGERSRRRSGQAGSSNKKAQHMCCTTPCRSPGAFHGVVRHQPSRRLDGSPGSLTPAAARGIGLLEAIGRLRQ